MAKIYKEIIKQDKKIKKWIARNSLTEKKQQNIKYMATAEWDIKIFLQDLPSVGVLPADFTLGSTFII